MKTLQATSCRLGGSVLLIVLCFTIVLSLLAASLLSFSGSETISITRRTSQIEALYGSESAVRRSMAQVKKLYFENYSTNGYLTGNLAAPTDTELNLLTSSQGPTTVSILNDIYTYSSSTVAFTTGSAANRYIQYTIPTTDNALTVYAGLTSQRATIQTSAESTSKNNRFSVPSRITQSFNIDYIPVFQYAIFYNMDMEVFNGPTMTVNGKVHSNGTLYYAPAATLTINSSLTSSGDIERGIKVWDSTKSKLLSSTSAANQTAYQNSQALWANDPANWASTDPTISSYGEASFLVQNAKTGSLVDFKISSAPTFYDSESAGWAGGALTQWGGGVKTRDQGIDEILPPVPTDVLAAASDPSNPYHTMIERPIINGSGVSTETSSTKSAKMGYNATVMIQRSGTNVIFRLKDSSGTWHQVNDVRNKSNIVPTTTASLRDQREYVQNGNINMTITELDLSQFYGAGSSTAGATDSAGVWKDASGSTIGTDSSGTAFTPVPFDGTIYIYDDDYSATRKPGIRIINGATLYDKDSNSTKNNGIAIISENPVYVQGNFNADGFAATGPEKTGGSKETVPPAMIAADVFNVLSTSWVSADDNPASTASTYFDRINAGNTEINAAILAGVNRSSQDVTITSFDGTTGGVNNFPRFLEHWSSTFKYSGSMVALWYGAQATSTYRGAGTGNGVFSAPTRDWAFNTDFLDPNNLPRCTPIIRVYTTANWSNL
jgi:hypothetical protein